MFVVTDHDDKDREDALIDVFDTRAAAEAFVAEWSAQFGTCKIEEWASLEDFYAEESE